MLSKPKNRMSTRIGDAALKAKTGKVWKEWYAILDKAGAKKMDHPAIAAYLYDKRKVPAWWGQMIAVGYEQARGLRQEHEKPSGYEISVSRTLNDSASFLFKAWKDNTMRKQWLPKPSITIHKSTPKKSLRITWKDGKKSVDVNFYPKGKNKCQVVVQHRMLPDAKTAQAMKSYWTLALNRLTVLLSVYQIFGKHYQ